MSFIFHLKIWQALPTSNTASIHAVVRGLITQVSSLKCLLNNFNLSKHHEITKLRVREINVNISSKNVSVYPSGCTHLRKINICRSVMHYIQTINNIYRDNYMHMLQNVSSYKFV